MTDAIIIGGGISGLSMAWFLKKEGIKPLLLERLQAPGGVIHSHRQNGFLIENGPNSVLPGSTHITDLIDDLGIAERVRYAAESARHRFVVKNGALMPIPFSPPALLTTRLFTASQKLRLFKEPWISNGAQASDETLADMITRRFGRAVLDYAVNPFIAGVYAGRPEDLSARSSFPELRRLEQEHGSIIRGAFRSRPKKGDAPRPKRRILSFDEGMQVLIDALAEKLNEIIRTSALLTSVKPADQGGYQVTYRDASGERQVETRSIILALPSHQYRTLPLPFAADDLAWSDDIFYPPVSILFLGYRHNPANRPLDGFGFLTPEIEKRRILGCIWNSALFPNRAPEGGAALTVFVGGGRQPELAHLPDNELTHLVQRELAELLGIHEAPEVQQIQRWAHAIPQYRLGHYQLVQQMELAETRHPGLYFTGNFRDGISVSDCIKSAAAHARRIASAQTHPVN